MKHAWLMVSVACLSGNLVVGDEVLFKSGDRLTGTVKSVDGGKMVFDSAVAGSITLKMADIKTFSTEKPIEIVQTNGTVAVQKVGAGAEGQVALLTEAEQPKTVALAEISKVNPPKAKWTGSIVANGVLMRGNTDSSTASVAAQATRRSEKDRIELGAGYSFASQRDNNTRKDSTIADNWFLKGKYDYFFSTRFFGYGNIKYEKDRIAYLDMRLSPGGGLGYQWLESPELNFFTEGGLSYVHEAYTDPDDTRDYLAARLAYHLLYTLNDHVKGFHNVEVFPNLADIQAVLVNADLGLRAAMTERLFMEAKAQLAYNSQPSDGRDKKDLRYTLGIGWTF